MHRRTPGGDDESVNTPTGTFQASLSHRQDTIAELPEKDNERRWRRARQSEYSQDIRGRYKPLQKTDWLPGNIVTSFLVVLAWGFLIWNASINTIWPMFGIANQLLASIALAIGTVYLVKTGKSRYAWTTALPFIFVTVTTLTAAWQMIVNHYWPKSATPFMVNFNTPTHNFVKAMAVRVFGKSDWQ